MSLEVKNCYNQLISEYINTENKQVFLELLANLEDNHSFAGKITWSKESEELDKKLGYDNDSKIEALKLLVKIFDIKPRRIQGLTGIVGNWHFTGTKTI